MCKRLMDTAPSGTVLAKLKLLYDIDETQMHRQKHDKTA